MFRAMSKSVFASSKSALVFAGMTIAGTLMMVGPGEGGGLLDQTVDRFGQQREAIAEEARVVSEERTEVIEPLDPAAGWGGTGDAVFGDYNAQEPPASEIDQPVGVAPVQSRSVSRSSSPAPTQIGGPVRADSPGVLVPREGAGAGQRGEAVVTSRSLTIEPQ